MTTPHSSQPAAGADASSQPSAASAVAAATPPEALLQQVMGGLEAAVGEVALMLKASGTAGAGDCQAMARQIVMGAWLNRNNASWDPTDPSTHRPDPNDPLLPALSQWGGAVPAAAQGAAGAAAR
jgi:hypothetical protein